MSHAHAVPPGAATGLIADVNFWRARNDARLDIARDERNEPLIWRYEGYQRITDACFDALSSAVIGDGPETFLRTLATQERIITETRARVWSDLMYRTGKQEAIRQMRALLQN